MMILPSKQSEGSAVARDDALRTAFEALAAASGGTLDFHIDTPRKLADEIGIDLARTPNPLYRFELRSKSETVRAVGFTLLVDGSKRPATRAEALGRALGASDGRFFALNPFLLVYDYVGAQFMVVSAIQLFGEFTKQADKLQKADSAAFSLSPNFRNGTIAMYAELGPDVVWRSNIAGELTVEELSRNLLRIDTDTKQRSDEIPAIVGAIRRRLNASSLATTASDSSARSPADFPEPVLRFDDRIRRMVRTAVRSATAVVLVGPPGTGKTTLLRQIFDELPAVRVSSELTQKPLWATPDESWTSRELVGGQTVVDGALLFRPGMVLRAIAQDRWLVLDEINRADMDRIFGGLLTWLSGGSVVLGMASTASDAAEIELGWNRGRPGCIVEGLDEQGRIRPGVSRIRYLAGEGWRLLGTYNAVDAQRVFRFGAALGRRFVRVPIPAPEPGKFKEALEDAKTGLSQRHLEGIVAIYSAHHEADETQLGPALFFSMCKYLMIVEDAPTDATLAEAYVVHAGTWLANLDRRDLEGLSTRIQARNALSNVQWEWVLSMIHSLA